MVRLVIDHTKLARRYPVDRVVRVNHHPSVGQRFHRGAVEFGRMADLECDAVGHARHALRQEVEVVDGEVALIGRRRVVAVGDVEDVLLHVLADDKPRSAAQSEALPLSDGMKP